MKYVFICAEQKVYIAAGTTQKDAYEDLKHELRVNDLDVIATYKVTEDTTP